MRDAIKTLWQYRFWRWSVYVFVGSIMVGQFARALERLTEPAPPQYAFEIPPMVLQCIEFPVPDQSDWTVPSFKFEQAVRFNFLDFKGTIRMPGSYQLSACDLNFPTKAPIKHVTFGAGGEVTIER